jgi:hypothetical protein
MRAIASAMSVAQELGIPNLCVYWKLEQHITIGFRDFFDMTAVPNWIQIIDLPLDAPEPFQTEVNSEEAWRAYLETHRELPTLRIKSWAAFYDANAQSWPSMCSNKASWVGPLKPTERWIANLRSLKFRPELVARAHAALEGRQCPVGVHIRRQDHINCMRYSPSEVFWEAMEKEQTIWFYVASDDMRERETARMRFPERVFTSPIPYRVRHSDEGLLDGAVEFLTLSLCSKIIGSFTSSFGEIAAVYGGIPFTPLHK